MSLLERPLSIIAPHACVKCGSLGPPVCKWCWYDTCESLPSRCYRCRTLTRDFTVCSACHHSSHLKSVWVRTEYDGHAKQLVQIFKFGRVMAAAPLIAKFMSEALPFLEHTTLVVPVPTASRRRRQRGYDQSELLAKALARDLDLKNIKPVLRVGESRQLGATRQQRLEQLTGAFSLRRQSAIIGKNILLVDDVITTGATLEAAAKVLKKAGAKRIDAVVFAQKL